jgi:O-antigen/teichoic acid export membrane protein
MALNISVLVGMVALFGVPTYLRRRVATEPSCAALYGTGALIILLVAALILSVGLTFTLWWLGLPIARDNVLPLAFVCMTVSCASSLLFSLLIGLERHTRFAWLNAGTDVCVRGACLVVVMAGASLPAYFATAAVVATVALLFGWYTSGIGLQRAALNPRIIGELLRGGSTFLAWSVVTQIRNQSDVILIGIFLSEHAAGWLSAAYRIISIPTFIPIAIVTPLLPALTRSAEDSVEFRHTLRRSLEMTLLLTVPAAMFIVALSSIVPELLHWGAEFQHAVPLMTILAFQQPIMGADLVLGTALMALHDERRWLRVLAAAAIFNVGMNLLLMPVFQQWLENGAIAAAVVEVGTELIMLGGALILLPRGTLDRRVAMVSGRVALAGVALLIVTLLLRSVFVPLAIVAGGATYLAVAMGLGVLRPADLQALRGAVLQRLTRRPGS